MIDLLYQDKLVALNRAGIPVTNVRSLQPGSYNPAHAGHLKMAELAKAKLGTPICFEISVKNVDKPAIDASELERRWTTFPTEIWKDAFYAVCTNAPTFNEKSQLFPGCAFIVGIDTWDRLNSTKYSADPDREIRKILDCGNTFMVFGRKIGETFLEVSEAHRNRYGSKVISVSESEFRIDVSSSQIRAAR